METVNSEGDLTEVRASYSSFPTSGFRANALSNRAEEKFRFKLVLTLTPKDRGQVTKMLADVPIFSGLSSKQVKSIAGAFARERSYDSGEVIEKEGGSAVAFYLITGGSVNVRKGETQVSKLGKGQFFGEMALIDNQPRSATVTAAEASKCLVMPVWSFRATLQKDPKIAMAVMKELARRLRETTNALTE